MRTRRLSKRSHQQQAVITELKMQERKDGENGWAVAIPVASEFLRESFKKTFKTGKWDSENKLWCVGIRSKKRLEQWVETMNAEGVIEAETELREAELSVSELEKIVHDAVEYRASIVTKAESARAQANNLRNDIKLLEKETEEQRRSKEVLASLKEEVAAAKEGVETAKAARDTEFEANKATLSQFIDIFELSDAHDDMITYGHRGHKGNNVVVYRQAQKLMSDAEESLKRAGLRCDAISELAVDKFNRAKVDDRDDAERFCMFDLCKVQAWTEDEE